jgi:16S rRNA (guanine1516-N2)-methyltransferase
MKRAQNIAEKIGMAVNCEPENHLYTLELDMDGTRLHTLNQSNQNPIEVNFHSGSHDHRRRFGGGKNQMIAKAVGVTRGGALTVLDATAGLGGDAFVLASLGCSVILNERSIIAHALLASGLEKGLAFAESAEDCELMAIFNRMTLLDIDSRTLLSQKLSTNNVSNNVIDVIYLDPMFPHRKKSAAVNKSMRAFQSLIGNDEDAGDLLDLALQQDICRVVVKRPKIAPPLANRKPSYALTGKSSRFDIYALKKFEKAKL